MEDARLETASPAAPRSIERTTVCVRELPLLADIGINPDEIGRRQPLVITIEVTLKSSRIEAIEHTVDYRSLVREAEELARLHIPLIEIFGRKLAERCLAMPLVASAAVRIDKPFAITRGLASVEVALEHDNM
ncbi:MAG: dihydroneopterin aldolase [Sphingomonadales bacterium]|nr:dihydroneopterin aldolase [Sphingomonadales bacterium]